MHVRLSTCMGTEVVDRAHGEVIGFLAGIFLHPDTGKVEGVFVRGISGLFARAELLFCGSDDILHWGTVLQIRAASCLAPLVDRIRLSALFAEGRTIVGQRVETTSGNYMGRCRDIQVDTIKMRLEWLFPRRLLRRETSLPISEVIEVRSEAVIVRDPVRPILASSQEKKEVEPLSFESFPEIAEA
jgi:sporulation protein YlmC with PRC-barrel domain